MPKIRRVNGVLIKVKNNQLVTKKASVQTLPANVRPAKIMEVKKGELVERKGYVISTKNDDGQTRE